MTSKRAFVAACLMTLGLPATAAQRVAVVVGVSQYPSIPAEAQPASARDDARALARFLEDDGGYDAVHVLLDAVATREGVRKLLLETVPPTVNAGDTFLFAFVGNGFGADFGDPYLMAYDFDPADPQGTGIQLQTFAPELVQKLEGANLVFITDAAHAGQVNGLALMGPSAKSWPSLQGNVFLLSAASPSEVAPNGMFVPLLTKGMSGGADTNGDGEVTVSELHRHLLQEVARETGDSVHPAEAGRYSPTLVVSDASAAPVVPPPVDPGKTPKAPKEPKSGGWGGPVSYSMMGVGAAVLGFGLYSYTQGRALCDDSSGSLSCPDTPEYNGARSRATIGNLAGGALLAGGVGLAFVPLANNGAWVGARARF